MKLLQAARLSRLGDQSTGIENQDQQARRFAQANGHDIIATAVDSDVSGDTDPWRREGLGPWLSDPEKISQYDGIIASHVDRLARSTVHFMRLLHWADDQNKRIITTGENGIDFSTPVGKLLGYIISWLGEQELEAIKRRARSSQAWLRENKYLVGAAPWGFRIVAKDDHKTLAPDPDLAPVIRDLVTRYIAGATLLALCQSLRRRGIVPPRGGQWNPATLRQTFQNQALIGRRRSRADGRVVLTFDPIIDIATWSRLQTAIKERSRRRSGRPADDKAMLTNVAVCAACGGPMYRHKLTNKRADGSRWVKMYYRCKGPGHEPSRCKNLIPEADLDAWLDSWLHPAEPYGSYEILERVTIPGNGHDAELEMNAADISDLAGRVHEIPAGEFMSRMAALSTERERLQARPAEPDRIETRATGITLGELWETLTTDAKRRYLLAADVKVRVRPQPEGERLPVGQRAVLVGDPWTLVSGVTGQSFEWITGPAAVDLINAEIDEFG